MVVPYDLAEEGGVKRHAFQLAATLRTLGDEVDVIGPLSRARRRSPSTSTGSPASSTSRRTARDNQLGIFVPPWRVRRCCASAATTSSTSTSRCCRRSLLRALVSPARRRAGRHLPRVHREREQPAAARAPFWGRIAFPSYRPRHRGVAGSGRDRARRVGSRSRSSRTASAPSSTARAAAPATGPLKLLFVGHWRDSRKGLPVLLDACAALRAARRRRGRSTSSARAAAGRSPSCPA